VDVASKVSPSRSEIPACTAVLICGDPFVAIRIDYSTAYVGSWMASWPKTRAPTSVSSGFPAGEWLFPPSAKTNGWLFTSLKSLSRTRAQAELQVFNLISAIDA
jgi:hypothetical protein